MTRELPVSIRTTSGPPERYYWRRVSHDRSEVTGAESVVGDMDSLLTFPLDADSGTATVAIVKPDGVIYISPSSITVELVPPVQVISQLQ
jgi:YbbR domain-containing protein